MSTKLERKLDFIHLNSLLFIRQEQHAKFQCFLFSLQFHTGLAGEMKSWVFLWKGQSCHHSATVSDGRKVENLSWIGISESNQRWLNLRVVSLGLLKGQILSDRERHGQTEAGLWRSGERMEQNHGIRQYQVVLNCSWKWVGSQGVWWAQHGLHRDSTPLAAVLKHMDF